ncbi:69_t:CDS:2, partial [Gigaspora rosea]
PWAIHPAETVLDTYVKQRHQFPRYVIYLDEEKQTRLLIGNNTIQVWRDEKLEFIRIVNNNPNIPEEPYEKFDVTKIRYGKQKLDLLISLEGKNIQIKIEHEDDIIQIVMNAINDSEKSKLKTKLLNKIEKERPLHSWQVPLQDILPDKDQSTPIKFKENQSTPSKLMELSEVKEIITKLFLPGKFSTIKNEDYSPFIQLDSKRLARLEKKYGLDLNEELDIDDNNDTQFFCTK